MEKILSFLLEHIELCVACFVALITLLLQILKKRPVKVVDSVKEALLMLIPTAINAAEKFYGSGNGQEKLDAVMKALKNYFDEHFPDCSFDVYRSFILKNIEHILSTPQKKGE